MKITLRPGSIRERAERADFDEPGSLMCSARLRRRVEPLGMTAAQRRRDRRASTMRVASASFESFLSPHPPRRLDAPDGNLDAFPSHRIVTASPAAEPSPIGQRFPTGLAANLRRRPGAGSTTATIDTGVAASMRAWCRPSDGRHDRETRGRHGAVAHSDTRPPNTRLGGIGRRNTAEPAITTFASSIERAVAPRRSPDVDPITVSRSACPVSACDLHPRTPGDGHLPGR